METRQMSRSEQTYDGDVQEDENGFTVSSEVQPDVWAGIVTGVSGGYVHLVFDSDNWALDCYLADPDDDGGISTSRIKTRIENVGLSPHYIGSERGVDDIQHFYLTAMKAETFRTFLASIYPDRDPEQRISLSWWEDSRMPMMENEVTTIESLNLRYADRQAQILSAWQRPEQKMVRLESEK